MHVSMGRGLGGGNHTGGMWRVLRLMQMKSHGILILRVPQSEMGIS